jgi:LysM repeat protein
MTFLRAIFCGLTVAALLAVTGCTPPGTGSADEQKDPYYLSGKRRVNSLDFGGAMEDFEKALEANPRSASAHFELGLLYEQRVKDYSAAIYHYERFLKYKPDTENAEIIRQRIITCKQELARTVSLGPVNQMVQRDLEQLEKTTKENAQLKQQLEQMQNQISQLIAMQMAQRGQSNANFTLPNTATTNRTVVRQVQGGPNPGTTGKPNGAGAQLAPASLEGRTHIVKSGDSLYGIAKQYGVSMANLQAANPGVDSKKLKLGQTLRIPTSR